MGHKRIYLMIAIALLVLAAVLLQLHNRVSEEARVVEGYFPNEKNITLVRNLSDDPNVAIHFPGLLRAYEVDGIVKAFVVNCVGYVGSVDVLVAIDDVNHSIKGLEILNHEETPRYAEHIASDWFIQRFLNQPTKTYLNLVVLEKENPEDIVQVTGATVSSQAVVHGVNSAMGAYEYLNQDNLMSRVPDVVPQEFFQRDTNSFAINWEGGSVRINTDTIQTYEQTIQEVVLINTTGTEIGMTVKGPTLRQLLEAEGLDLDDYEGIGVTARDGYYAMIDREKLEKRDVILVWQVDGEELDEAEKPMRVAVPEELGPYWVKMVAHIDLYDAISPKAIEKVHFFEALTRELPIYAYEYYGTRDKSYEVGRILRQFDFVDEKGLFTMGAADGLIKNETIAAVRQRYYIKVEGENAPMNIAPNFKLGMNVKHMTYFSTTTDSVVFPDQMGKVMITKEIDGSMALPMGQLLQQAGMVWEEDTQLVVFNTQEQSLEIPIAQLEDYQVVLSGQQVDLYHHQQVMSDLLRIEKHDQ